MCRDFGVTLTPAGIRRIWIDNSFVVVGLEMGKIHVPKWPWSDFSQYDVNAIEVVRMSFSMSMYLFVPLSGERQQQHDQITPQTFPPTTATTYYSIMFPGRKYWYISFHWLLPRPGSININIMYPYNNLLLRPREKSFPCAKEPMTVPTPTTSPALSLLSHHYHHNGVVTQIPLWVHWKPVSGQPVRLRT